MKLDIVSLDPFGQLFCDRGNLNIEVRVEVLTKDVLGQVVLSRDRAMFKNIFLPAICTGNSNFSIDCSLVPPPNTNTCSPSFLVIDLFFDSGKLSRKIFQCQ